MLDVLDEAPIVGPKPEAFRRQIASLKVGESASKARRLSLSSPEASDLTGFTRTFRVSIDSEVSKQRKATGRDFVVEQGTIMCGAGFVLVVIVVTRTEGL